MRNRDKRLILKMDDAPPRTCVLAHGRGGGVLPEDAAVFREEELRALRYQLQLVRTDKEI